MLYVFYVNAGEMLTFSMDLIMSSVAKLQEVIETRYGMAVDSQVLLVSGGEHMDPSRVIGSYKSAGTETSPLFLYNKCCPDTSSVAAFRKDAPDYNELGTRVETACSGLPPTRETVAMRARFAQQLHENARDSVAEVQQLIHGQHLQHQGWAAVVATFDDLTRDFEKHGKCFDDAHSKFKSKKSNYQAALNGLEAAVSMLGRARLLPCFLKQLEASHLSGGSAGGDASSANTGSTLKDRLLPSAASTTSSNQPITLLDWIAHQEQRTSIMELASQASAEVETLSDEVLERTSQAMHKVLDRVNAEGEDMKEIKGLSGRLSGLEMLLVNARNVEDEQRQMASSLVQHMTRCRDMSVDLSSVLPELSASHREQLRQMWRNTTVLRDIVLKCTAAKLELCKNLRTRLAWMTYVQRKIAQVDGQLSMQSYFMRLLSQKLDIIVEVHDAPRIYATLCAEAHRRQRFCTAFQQWADGISVNAKEIYQSEARYRQKFLERIGRHFLRSLFPKLHAQPSTFAAAPPRVLENDVPDVTAKDIVGLCEELPELANTFRGQDEESGASMLVLSRVAAAGAVSSFATTTTSSPCSAGEKAAAVHGVTADTRRDQFGSSVAPPTPCCQALDGASLVPDSAAYSPAMSSYFVSLPKHPSPAIGDVSYPCSADSGGCVVGARLLSYKDARSDQSPSPSQIPDDEDHSLPAPHADPDDEGTTGTQFALELDSNDFVTAHRGEPHDSAEPSLRAELHLQSAAASLQTAPTNQPITTGPAAHGCVVTTEQLREWHARVAEALRQQRTGVAECRKVIGESRDDFRLAVDECARLVERCRAELALRDASQREKRDSEAARLALAECEAAARESAASQALLQCELDVDEARQQLADRLAAAEASHAVRAERDAAELASLARRLAESSQENGELRATVTRLQEGLERATTAVARMSHTTPDAHSLSVPPECPKKAIATESRLTTPPVSANCPSTELCGSDFCGRDFSLSKGGQNAACQTDSTWFELLADLEAKIKAESDVALKQAMDKMQRQHEEEMNDIFKRFEEEHDLRMTVMKTSMVADSQVAFNEAVSRLVAEKERKIEILQAELVRMQSLVPTAPGELVPLAGSRASSALPGDCSTSPTDVSASTKSCARTPPQEKVAITSCNVGDLVLLCFNEEHGQYVVLTIGTVFHFLHNDSYEALQLKSDGNKSPKVSWVLAEVTDKEYCEAKKVGNRFHVPVGTRFFRVKAKPWPAASCPPKIEKGRSTAR